MNMTNDRYWNETLVMAYLQDATAIHRRLPPVKVPTYHTFWPEMPKGSWEKFYDAVNGKTRLGSPMPAEVSFSDEVLEWLRWLDRHHQKVIFMRSSRIPWKIITAELGKCKTTLWYDMKNSLIQIGAHLEKKDPQGEYFRHLRCRANGVFNHLQTL